MRLLARLLSSGIGAAVVAVVAGSVVGAGCDRGTGSGGSGSGAGGAAGGGGGSGGSGGCLMVPAPTFLVAIRAEDGPLPKDTAIDVNWSAGEAGPFLLDDPKTWHGLDRSNLFCHVDPQHPPPMPMQELHCEIWTSGATEIGIKASGYTSFDRTFSPPEKPCAPPTRLMVDLARPKPDGGT